MKTNWHWYRSQCQFAWGDQDPFGGLDVARRAVDTLPDARLHIIGGGGHLPWFDDAPGVARLFAAFLDECT